MLKYLFISGETKDCSKTHANSKAFSYHKKSALRALLSGFLMAAFVEATVLHILLWNWSHWLATAATVSSVVVGFQIAAQIRAVGIRPIRCGVDKVFLRNGAFDLAEISYDQIASIQATTRAVEVDAGSLKPLHVCFPAFHNTVLTLKGPAEAKILNRKQRNFQIALLALDDVDAFVHLIEEQIAANEKDQQGLPDA